MTIKSSIVLLTAVAISKFSAAQTPRWDSTFRPPAYDLRVAQFRMFPNSQNDIIFLGNSITTGVEWQELLGNPNARNRGISGDITFGVLARLDEVTEGQPAKVFLLIGINDISKGIPDSVISANHRRIVRYIKTHSPRTEIYLQTILPVNKDFGKHQAHYNKDEDIANVNRGLKLIAREEKVEIIDTYSKFLNDNGKLTDKYTYDGLHLTAEGYKHWAAILQECGCLK